MPAVVAAAPRCAVHPVRVAVDACPACGRPRCAADAAADPDRCRADRSAPAARLRAAPVVPGAVLLAAGGLAVYTASLLVAVVASQYAGLGGVSVLVDGLAGVVVGLVGATVAGRAAAVGPPRRALRAATALGALVAAMYAVRLTPGGPAPWGSQAEPLGYAAAVLGALAGFGRSAGLRGTEQVGRLR